MRVNLAAIDLVRIDLVKGSLHVLRDSEETVPAVYCDVCTSHAPRPMFGLGTRLRVRMRTTFEMASYATDSNRAELRTVLSTCSYEDAE